MHGAWSPPPPPLEFNYQAEPYLRARPVPQALRLWGYARAGARGMVRSPG